MYMWDRKPAFNDRSRSDLPHNNVCYRQALYEHFYSAPGAKLLLGVNTLKLVSIPLASADLWPHPPHILELSTSLLV